MEFTEEVKSELYDVQKIHGSSYAFAAIRADGQVLGVSFLTVGREAAMVSWKFLAIFQWCGEGWDVEVWITRLGWLGNFFDSKWRVVELSHLQVLRRESFFVD